MVVAGLAQRSAGGLAGENGRNAAGWGATYLLVTVPCGLAILGLVIVAPDLEEGFLPYGPLVFVPLAATVMHLVVCLVGLSKAMSGQSFRAPGTLPILRGER